MVILLRYVGSNVKVPNELVDQLLAQPDPVVSDKSVQDKYAQCLLHYTRKIWSDVGRVIRTQDVMVNNIEAEVSRLAKAEQILKCWERMYSKPVALSSFRKFLCEAHGVLLPLAYEESITEYNKHAVAHIIANMYLEHNDWYARTTTELRVPQTTDKSAVSESAVHNKDKYIQERFLQFHANAEYLKEGLVLSLRPDVCEVLPGNKGVAVRANTVVRPIQGDASRKLLNVTLKGNVTVRDEENAVIQQQQERLVSSSCDF